MKLKVGKKYIISADGTIVTYLGMSEYGTVVYIDEQGNKGYVGSIGDIERFKQKSKVTKLKIDIEQLKLQLNEAQKAVETLNELDKLEPQWHVTRNRNGWSIYDHGYVQRKGRTIAEALSPVGLLEERR